MGELFAAEWGLPALRAQSARQWPQTLVPADLTGRCGAGGPGVSGRRTGPAQARTAGDASPDATLEAAVTAASPDAPDMDAAAGRAGVSAGAEAGDAVRRRRQRIAPLIRAVADIGAAAFLTSTHILERPPGPGPDTTGAASDPTGAGRDANGAGRDATGAAPDATGVGCDATGRVDPPPGGVVVAETALASVPGRARPLGVLLAGWAPYGGEAVRSSLLLRFCELAELPALLAALCLRGDAEGALMLSAWVIPDAAAPLVRMSRCADGQEVRRRLRTELVDALALAGEAAALPEAASPGSTASPAAAPSGAVASPEAAASPGADACSTRSAPGRARTVGVSDGRCEVSASSPAPARLSGERTA